MDDLSEENLDSIDSAISRMYESLLWVKTAIASQDNPKYKNIEWLLINNINRNKRNGKSFILRIDPSENQIDKVFPTKGCDRRIIDASSGLN